MTKLNSQCGSIKTVFVCGVCMYVHMCVPLVHSSGRKEVVGVLLLVSLRQSLSLDPELPLSSQTGSPVAPAVLCLHSLSAGYGMGDHTQLLYVGAGGQTQLPAHDERGAGNESSALRNGLSARMKEA